MRLAAKRARNQLDWSVLDVEQEEWDRQLADLGIAAAANGFPFHAAAVQAGAQGQEGLPAAHNPRQLRIGRLVVFAAAAMLVLAGLMGYAVWRTAHEGIMHMQGEVANAVKLETIRNRTQRPDMQIHEAVKSVELMDNAAMAAVEVSSTLPSGKIVVQSETHFYKSTPTGWQRTAPLAAFWGVTETLDTKSLHFVFGSKDRAEVEQVAPTADSLYATLRRATGHDLRTDGLLTVEIVPDSMTPEGMFDTGRIRLSSPLLYRVAAAERGKLFGQLLRRALASQMLNAALQRAAPKDRWLPMVKAFDSWLKLSDAVQPVPVDELAALRPLRMSAVDSLSLANLLGNGIEHNMATAMVEAYSPGHLYQQEQRWVTAQRLIEFIAATYGIDVLPKLLQGFAQYDDWETLAPAVLGVSAAELEKAWHASATHRYISRKR